MIIDMSQQELHLYMCWYPQALFVAEQACRRRFFVEKQYVSLQGALKLTKNMFPVVLTDCAHSKQTPNRCGRKTISKQRSNYDLSSYIDPVGDQNDVRYLSAFATIK